MKPRRVKALPPAPPAGAAPPEDLAHVVGENVRQARQRLGWTQVDLAVAAGVSPNYLARLERGEVCASLQVCSQVCAALSISLNDLTHRTPAPSRSGTRGVRRG